VPPDTELPVYSSTREGLKRQDAYFDGKVLQNKNDYGVVPPGCLVYRHMSDDGLFKFNINETGGEIAVSKEYPVFSTKGLNSVFLLAKLNDGLDFKHFALSQKAGGTRTRLYFSRLCEWRTLLPYPAEQQKIAECLSSVDELLAAQALKVDALKTHKKGLMHQLFPREGETEPRLRFPEFHNAGEWDEKKLGTICDIQRGKFSHRPRNDPKFFGGQYPFIQTGDVVKSEGGAVIASQSLNEEGLAVSKLFKPTVVLITIAANIGDTGLLLTEGCFTDSVVGLIPQKGTIPVFLELIMRGQKDNLNKVATTGAQKNINNEILREVSVLLPSVPEQQRIATCLSSLDALIIAETQKHEALKTHKKGLMQQLFPSLDEVVP
jgi:type I restriction enzyme S subunit